MILHYALRDAIKRLQEAGVDEARLDAEYLISAAVGRPRLELVVDSRRVLTEQETARFHESVRRRAAREPLAYILQEQPFFDLSLTVNPNVLIPRPETELLVEHAQKLLGHIDSPIVADIGTGSGNIAIALARAIPKARIYAVDISIDALKVAQMNSQRHALEDRIQWRHGNLLETLITDEPRFDLIVANLPYVTTAEMDRLAPEVQREPRLALDGGPEGLDAISKLVRQAPAVLKPGGALLLEIGAHQDAAVRRLLAHFWHNISIYKDGAGWPRIVHAQLSHQEVSLGSAHH